MDYIDLHTHSCVSDGTMTPTELFDLACELHLSAVALTDHDTTGGIAEFLAAGAEHPECEAVPGVELACSCFNREIHIVGLFIDHRNAVLQNFIETCRAERTRRNRDLFAKLKVLGYELDENAPPFAGESFDSVGRPHFARALKERYGFATLQSVFEKLLGHGRPAYVPRRLPDPVKAIEAIHAAGGVAVWAHPVLRGANEHAYLNRACRKFAERGLDAIEGYYSTFSSVETEMVTLAAAKYGLALSGGSDFHGENSPNVVMGFGSGGLRVPDSLLSPLKARRML